MQLIVKTCLRVALLHSAVVMLDWTTTFIKVIRFILKTRQNCKIKPKVPSNSEKLQNDEINANERKSEWDSNFIWVNKIDWYKIIWKYLLFTEQQSESIVN